MKIKKNKNSVCHSSLGFCVLNDCLCCHSQIIILNEIHAIAKISELLFQKIGSLRNDCVTLLFP